MVKCYIFIGLFLLVGSVHAQEVFRVPARFRSLGNASVSLQSPLAIFSNPAGFSATTTLSAGIMYENRFLLKELQTTSAFLVVPVENTKLGISFSQFGKGGYRENKLSFGMAKSLSPRLTAGLQFHYYTIYLAENSERPGAVLIDFGTQFQLADQLWLGVQIFNPYEIGIQTHTLDLDYPLVMRLGMHKTFEDAVLLAVELKKRTDQPVAVCSGLEIRIREAVQLRLGVDSGWSTLSMGVGFSFGQLQSDLAFSYHQYLGTSPSVSIYYQLP